MAVVKNPFLSIDARGSVGGMTASMVRGGNVMKKKSRPTTSYLPGVTRVRSILGHLSRDWGGLTVPQRDSWIAWANDHPGQDKFGDPFIMSGFNAFIKLNLPAVFAGGHSAKNNLPPEDPPASAVDVLTGATGATNPGDVDLTWTEAGTGIAADFFQVDVAGPFQSEGKLSVNSRFVHKLDVAGNVLLVTIDSLDEGFWYWFRVRYLDAAGQTTAWHTVQVTPKLTP